MPGDVPCLEDLRLLPSGEAGSQPPVGGWLGAPPIVREASGVCERPEGQARRQRIRGVPGQDSGVLRQREPERQRARTAPEIDSAPGLGVGVIDG